MPCFFSGLQETWPPCAEEPFGTGQERGNGGGGGHSVKMWVILKLENNPKGLWSGEERGSGSLDSKRSIALIEVPPSHCVCLLFFFCLSVFILAQLLHEHCAPHVNAWHTVWHFLEAADKLIQKSVCGISATCCC